MGLTLPMPTRVVLLFIAVLCGGFVALLGDAFSHAVERLVLLLWPDLREYATRERPRG